MDGKRRINILFIIIQTKMGGAERLVYNLILGLDRKLFNPSLSYFFKGNELKEFQKLGIPIHHVPKVKRFDILSMRNIARIIKDKNIDIVNAHHFMPMVYSFYGCKIVNKIKLICTEHSEWEVRQTKGKWRLIGHFLLKYVDISIGVTDKIREAIEHTFRLKPSKTATIRNGVNIEEFSKTSNINTINKRLNIDIDNCKIIGMVANFRKVKNHMFLLKGFSRLIKDYSNVKLLLIGQSFDTDPMNSEEEIMDYIAKKGLSKKVINLGYRSDISDLVKIMDVFCLTSLKEGLPISLIEAMAAGLPVVGTDVEGIRDLIYSNKNGFLVKLGDEKGLKDALLTLLRNEVLRLKFGNESISLVKRRYSLERCINQYTDLFLSIAS